jgi:hypothetical protein
MTNAPQDVVCESRDRPASWSVPQIERAIVATLMMRFPDWEVSGIKIDEREAQDIAADISLELIRHSYAGQR